MHKEQIFLKWKYWKLEEIKCSINNKEGLFQALYPQEGQPFTDLTLQFRETNTSFVDFVVRPWIILAEHFGRIARPPGDQRNVGTTIKILQFTRTYQQYITNT